MRGRGRRRAPAGLMRACARTTGALGRALHRNALGLGGAVFGMCTSSTPALYVAVICSASGSTQREAPAEGAERPFAVMRIAMLPVLGTVLDQAFTLQRQDIVLNGNIDIVLLHAGKIRHQDEFLVVLAGQPGRLQDSWAPEAAWSRNELNRWSISARNDSIPVKGLQDSWDGLHGIVGFQRTNAIAFPSLSVSYGCVSDARRRRTALQPSGTAGEAAPRASSLHIS